jgi:hypothetical protein
MKHPELYYCTRHKGRYSYVYQVELSDAEKEVVDVDELMIRNKENAHPFANFILLKGTLCITGSSSETGMKAPIEPTLLVEKTMIRRFLYNYFIDKGVS